jgi:hypothetical protein
MFRKPPRWLTRTIFVAGWAVIIILPIVGPLLIEDSEHSGYFYGLSGAWCWLGDGYQLERFIYLYVSEFGSARARLTLFNADVDLHLAYQFHRVVWYALNIT